MSSTAKPKKKATEKALPSYPALSLPELLIQYDDWVAAARLFDWNLMQQLYHRLKRGTIALLKSGDLENRLWVELEAAGGLVRQMAEELAQRVIEFANSQIDPRCQLHFDNPQVVERLALRIARIKRMSRDDRNVHGLPEGYRWGKEVVGKDGLPIAPSTISDWGHSDDESPKRCNGKLIWRIEWLDKRIAKHTRRPKRQC